MDERINTLDGNRYAQIISKNHGYFAKLYPMHSKGKACKAFKIFCHEFGIPEHLIFYGYKEQCDKRTEFMKQILKNDVSYKF